ncbi:selection and upkeep of intraepithelial T-cells protein 1 [Larimichthys crocea]|uniref:selection and upkeep of intraepithelial T-cells protein 1 n=1 Tax=Larimichthys crocea TaxID=215358 RepID=UPI0009011587|nr:selection and upkeep of intraepithelial T-cells protein 1 [Larimichthys crocea]
MRTFLGVIMVLIVSGDCENVSSILSGSVLLPCSCPERELNDPFYWQKERPKMLVFKYRNGNSTFNDTYKGRGKIFLPEDGKNCSVLLTNVTADDQGQYRCSFNHQGVHRKIFVNLNVYASYSVCQKNFTECHVKGLYRDAEIEWSLDGQPLTSSPTTDITLDDSTGLYHFTSRLITSLNGTSRPTCTVKAKGVTPDINHCIHAKEARTDTKTLLPLRYRCLKIIPIVLVLGFFLVLWHRLKFSESKPTTRQREIGNCYCKTGKTNSNVTI